VDDYPYSRLSADIIYGALDNTFATEYSHLPVNKDRLAQISSSINGGYLMIYQYQSHLIDLKSRTSPLPRCSDRKYKATMKE
jgi:hypothetical protein